MKKNIFLILIFLSASATAQHMRIPDGTWVSDSACTTYLNDTLQCDDCCETYISPFTFTFSNGRLYSERESGKSNSGYLISRYSMNRNTLRIKKTMMIDSSLQITNPGNYYRWYPKKYLYECTNDSVFTLINKWDNCKSVIKAHKAPTQTFLTVAEIKNINQQRLDSATAKKIVLIKKDSTLKKKTLKTNGHIELCVDSTGNNWRLITTEYSVAKFAAIKDSSYLYIYPSSVEEEIETINGFSGTLSKGYASYRVGYDFIPIAKDSIRYLKYYKPGEYGTWKKLNAIGWMSFVSALFVAPLVSLKFSPMGFNSHRYLKVAGASLLTMTVSFSLKSFFNGKLYYTGNKYGINGWRFE